MKDISYEAFHKYVTWWQKSNKKNPWKFWTVEMYSFIIDGIRLEILQNEQYTKEDILNMLSVLDDSIDKYI